MARAARKKRWWGGQVALAVLILSAATLIGRSFLKLRYANLAFDASHVVVAELAIRYDQYNTTDKQLPLIRELVAQLRATPGVQGVSPVVAIPFSGAGGWTGRARTEEQSMEMTVWDIYRVAGIVLVGVSLGSPAASAAQTVVRLSAHDSVRVIILGAPTASACPGETCAIALEPLTPTPDTLRPQRTVVALWQRWRPRLDSAGLRALVISTITTPRTTAPDQTVDYGDGIFLFARAADGHWLLYGKRYTEADRRLLIDPLPQPRPRPPA